MEKYSTPELKITEFNNEDVITTSLLTGEDEMDIIKG